MSSIKKKGGPLNRRVIGLIIRCPNMTDNEIAENLGTYREKVWRIRKKMYETDQIWGTSVIVDESRLNRQSYIMFIKFRNISEEAMDIVLELISEKVQNKHGIMIKFGCYINAHYDIILTFSTEERSSASKYYEFAKKQLAPDLAEELKMVDIAFCLANGALINPNIKEIYKVVPE